MMAWWEVMLTVAAGMVFGALIVALMPVWVQIALLLACIVRIRIGRRAQDE